MAVSELSAGDGLTSAPATQVLATVLTGLLDAERSWVHQQAERLEAAACLLVPVPGELPAGDPLLARLEQTLQALAAEFRARAASLGEATAVVDAAKSEREQVEPYLPLV